VYVVLVTLLAVVISVFGAPVWQLNPCSKLSRSGSCLALV
jgi:hypothetical protein